MLKFIKSLFYSLLCCLIFVSHSYSDEKQTVKIGVIVPLTGGLAKRGQDVSHLIEIIKPHINSSTRKYRYEFLIDDGKCGAGNSATTIVKKFIHIDKVKFLVTGCSGETLQVGPIAQRKGIVTVAVLSTHQDVKELGDYVFRTFVDIERGVEKFAQYMGKRSQKRVAILTEENAFTFGIKELLHKHLGSQVVFSDDFSPDTHDFNSLLLKIKANKANGVYFNVLSEGTLAVLVNQTRALGLNQQIYSYNMPEASSFRKAVGRNGENLEFIGTPEIQNASEEFNEILKEFMIKHPQGPSYEFLLRTFYDAVKSMVDGIEKVGPDPTLVKSFLTTYKSVGALGEVSYDENGDIHNINYVLRRVQDGEIEYMGELVGPEAIS